MSKTLKKEYKANSKKSLCKSKKEKKCKKINVLPLGPMLAEAIRRISNKESISAMFL